MLDIRAWRVFCTLCDLRFAIPYREISYSCATERSKSARSRSGLPSGLFMQLVQPVEDQYDFQRRLTTAPIDPVIVITLHNARAILPPQEIEEEEDSGCESEGQILTPPSSPGSGQGHSNSSHSSSGSSMLDVHNLNLHGTGGRSAIVRVTTSNAQGVAR